MKIFRRQILFLILLAFGGILLSGAAAYIIYIQQEEQYILKQRNLLGQHLQSFLNEINDWKHSIIEMEAFYNASSVVDKEEFDTFVSTITRGRPEGSVFGWMDAKDIDQLSSTYLYPEEDFDIRQHINDDLFAQLEELCLHEHHEDHDLDFFISNIHLQGNVPYVIFFKAVEKKGYKNHGILGVLYISINLEKLPHYRWFEKKKYSLTITEKQSTLSPPELIYKNNPTVENARHVVKIRKKVNFHGQRHDHHYLIEAGVNTDRIGFEPYHLSAAVFIGGFLVTAIIFYYFLAMAKAKRRAEQANQSKSDFLSNMSHELRTPLNSILGIIQLLDRNSLDKNTREMFELIKQSSSSLLSTVNDILDLSKIEAGEVELEARPFDAVHTIHQVVQTLLPLASRKGLQLSCKITRNHCYVLGDSLRLNRILTNLVGNALRYTKEGSINVHVNIRDDALSRVMLRCEIIDTGIGIPAEKLRTVFEKFSQADLSTTREFGGTGLGLTITKDLIELMEGRINVESTEGVGSKFWFEIPFRTVVSLPEQASENTSPGDNVAPVDAIPAGDVRILMAEDHDMNQRFMKKLFHALGITHYHIVENGREALKAIQSDQRYDLVLMDYHMPEMNGHDATEAIRTLNNKEIRDIPIIAMTANAMPKDEERCLAIGMNAYISKPVDIDIFRQVLAPWISFDTSEHNQNTETDTDKNTTSALKNNCTTTGKPAINLEILQKNSMGDEAFIREMIEMFITRSATLLEELESLCHHENYQKEEWTEVCHALKGTAANAGAEAMRALCATAQEMDAQLAEERQAIFRQISTEYKHAKTYVITKGLYEES